MTDRIYAKSSFFANVPNVDGTDIVVEVPSQSNHNKKYRVDLTHGRCSCPAWIFQKGGVRTPCKHLRDLGYVAAVEPTEVKEAKTSELESAEIAQYEGVL